MSFTLQSRSPLAATPVSDAERRMRVDLAAAYRLVACNGWDDLVYSHISASVPGEPGRFLINPFGLGFDEVTASSLVKITESADVVGESAHGVNVTGFALHAALHAARPDAVCVFHLHETATIAVSAQPDGLLPISQHALRFVDDLAYHAYQGLVFTPEEGATLAAALGRRTAMLLRNHGPVVLGRTIAEAYVLMATLIKACAIQLAAQGSGVSPLRPDPGTIARAARDLKDDGAIEGVLEWPSLLRRLDRLDPTYAR